MKIKLFIGNIALALVLGCASSPHPQTDQFPNAELSKYEQRARSAIAALPSDDPSWKYKSPFKQEDHRRVARTPNNFRVEIQTNNTRSVVSFEFYDPSDIVDGYLVTFDGTNGKMLYCKPFGVLRSLDLIEE